MGNGIYKTSFYNQKKRLIINLTEDFINKRIEVLVIPSDDNVQSIKTFEKLPDSFKKPFKVKKIILPSRDDIHER